MNNAILTWHDVEVGPFEFVPNGVLDKAIVGASVGRDHALDDHGVEVFDSFFRRRDEGVHEGLSALGIVRLPLLQDFELVFAKVDDGASAQIPELRIRVF